MPKHGVCPVVDWVFGLGVKFANEEIDNGKQVGYEHGIGGNKATINTDLR